MLNTLSVILIYSFLTKDLEASIDTAAGKVVTKMIFGLRDTLETDAFIDCVEGLEKVYEE